MSDYYKQICNNMVENEGTSKFLDEYTDTHKKFRQSF